MGRYDSLHTGTFCGQVKCLGKGLRNLVLGDEVTLHVIPFGPRAEEIARALEVFQTTGADPYDHESPLWLLYNGEKSALLSYQIKAKIGYINVVDGVFTSWTTDETVGLPVLGNGGAALSEAASYFEEAGHYVAWGEESNLAECGICAALASGMSPKEWRAESRAQAVARRVRSQAEQAAGKYDITKRTTKLHRYTKERPSRGSF